MTGKILQFTCRFDYQCCDELQSVDCILLLHILNKWIFEHLSWGYKNISNICVFPFRLKENLIKKNILVFELELVLCF